jgi:hypothetical protein
LTRKRGGCRAYNIFLLSVFLHLKLGGREKGAGFGGQEEKRQKLKKVKKCGNSAPLGVNFLRQRTSPEP